MTGAYKTPQMEACSRCGGHGLVMYGDGEPCDCSDCGGSGAAEARDARGRFLPWRTVPAEHDFVIREVVDGRIEIEGVTYAPKRPYDGSLDGHRLAFGRYWTGDEIARGHPDGLAFVCLWGTEAAYLSQGEVDDRDSPIYQDGAFAFEWWDEVRG